MERELKLGMHVYFVHPECVDSPICEGTIEAIYDDGSVDVWEEYLGSICVDRSEVFATKPV